MTPTNLNLFRLGAARATTTGTVARAALPPRMAIASSQVRFQSSSGQTVGQSAAKGPSGPEASPQGSDQRGKATSYALPVVAVSLVLFALFIRLSSKDSKQNAVNVGIGTDGASKLKGSKARSIADDKANAQVEENIK